MPNVGKNPPGGIVVVLSFMALKVHFCPCERKPLIHGKHIALYLEDEPVTNAGRNFSLCGNYVKRRVRAEVRSMKGKESGIHRVPKMCGQI
jgi:hypothetical protein